MGIKCPRCQSVNPETATFCADCGTKLTSLHPEKEIPFSRTRTIQQPSRALAEGSMLAGKYRILEPIGKGGMGVVYKAEDTKLKRTVAVKFLPSELSDDSEAGERFLREAQAAAALSHHHICTIHEINEEEQQPFIVMEYVEGQSLNQKIKQGPLGQAVALEIAIQVAEGLEEAHKKGIIHRDIKPGNIMLTTKGQAKVMDFGLAKVLGASLITKEARTMGTVAYMSPEQAKGEILDSKTDIWSLGVVLYEMLTGQLPFKGEYDQSVIHSILTREPEPLTKVRSNIPKDLENVVHTALAKNPADRYQDMDEFLKDLKAIAQELKPLGAKVGLLRKRIFGIKKVYAFAGLATLILFITLAVIFLILRGGQVYDSIAILPLINDSGDPNQDYFANSLTTLMISELYKVAALKVAPPESVRLYKNSNKTPKEIAQELNVKAIVQASVLVIENKIRLVATLSDPFQNKILWSKTLEKEYSEIMILQSELAQDIVSGIKVAVTPEEKSRLTNDLTVNPEAMDLVLKGIEFYSSPAGPGLIDHLFKASDCFQKAIDIDPSLALAHAWKAHLCVELAGSRWANEKEQLLKAKEAVERALNLDDNLAQAHASFGLVKLSMDWDFAGAEREMKKAMELAPGELLIPFYYDAVLCWSGRAEEAIQRVLEVKRALGDRTGIAFRQLLHFLWAKRYDEALEELKIEDSRNPNASGYFVRWYAVVYALKGLYPEALAEIDKTEDQPFWKAEAWFRRDRAWVLAICGRREKALEALDEHKSIQAQKNIDSTYDEACVYSGLGDKDRAFEYLNKAFENHSSQMVRLIADWCFHSLHGDPRFEELRKKVGFSEIRLPAKEQ